MSIITVQNTGVFSPDGKEIVSYTLKDSRSEDFVEVLNIGCALRRIVIHDKNNVPRDMSLSHRSLEDFVGEHASIYGTVIGRFANRISNAKFSINGTEYHLNPNEGKNTLHGGLKGFNSKFWDAEVKDGKLILSYTSPDLEEGFPGTMKNTVTYAFDNHALSIEYDSVCDKDSIVNLTNHCFFNTSGHDGGSTLDLELKIYSDRYCPVDDCLLLSGEKRSVEGTPFDFRQFKAVGKDIDSDDYMIKGAKGYDLCYALDGPEDELRLAAELKSAKTGINMKTYTTMPAVQLYTGMLLGGTDAYKYGKDDAVYEPYGGLCLETQQYPDSVNIAEFPDVVLKAGVHKMTKTVYEFVVKK